MIIRDEEEEKRKLVVKLKKLGVKLNKELKLPKPYKIAYGKVGLFHEWGNKIVLYSEGFIKGWVSAIIEYYPNNELTFYFYSKKTFNKVKSYLKKSRYKIEVKYI